MRIFSIVIALIFGVLGIYLCFRSFGNFRSMTKGETSLRHQVNNSIVAGVAGFLIFFSMIMLMGFFDETYIWSINKFFGVIFVSMIPAVIIIIGSFVQSIMITGYRKRLLEVLKRKDKTD